MNKRLLITGFDPFGDNSINPSWLAVEQLPDTVGNFTLCKQMIPTVFGKAAAMILKKAEAFQPDVILCIGLAGGRSAITPERIAINIRDARIPDNEGNQYQGTFVVPGGPAAYFATVPVNEIAHAVRDAEIPAVVSNSAGTFVCNDTLYTLLHHYAQTDTQVGFIHVPNIPELGTPSMPLERITRALYFSILACDQQKT